MEHGLILRGLRAQKSFSQEGIKEISIVSRLHVHVLDPVCSILWPAFCGPPTVGRLGNSRTRRPMKLTECSSSGGYRGMGTRPPWSPESGAGRPPQPLRRSQSQTWFLTIFLRALFAGHFFECILYETNLENLHTTRTYEA